MSNETKRDVFEDLVEELANAYIALDGEGIGDDLTNEEKQAYLKDYDNALPDDLPVLPEGVSEYTKRMIPILGGPYIRDDVLTEPLFSIFLTIQHNLNKDYPPDFKAENWIIDHSDTFARAWVLGVWRVEETGEIVKLEAEK
ncbi:hypothetical protein [Lacticaseibacillus paracasei]|uniref:hypothetical protein n=1 Tax=Lacticaseibacillus paracasei TaxID=1597 RepID=UPI000BC2F940|nr:hypothetical protein [Lacticaseibacillus paracasei]ATG98005.1 hypothetical protein FAM18149p_00665 [Lacticaseibacillus paracasei]RND76030.1 hypothetical protein FAM18149_02360 [Lacticaseibacillus paracasei]RND81862.1 hypothetical protein FAM18168_02192 [Lacticaseibacillus paracasei]